MVFDNPTRTRLQRLVGACRKLLTEEFDAQLQERYGIYADEERVLPVEKLPHLDDEQARVAALLRERIQHLAAAESTSPKALGEAVQRVLREQAFTVLNRFAAIRMAEERGIIQESIGGGLRSKGFQVFETVARSGLGAAYERWRVFIYCLYDEISVDLGVLFDRFSPVGLLFPREPALLELFRLLNEPEVKPLWREDETIGWIYQYYNDPGERKKMREGSAAPRNSRELAVRNQFFTPRYVVEFLTDNTLGRLWYEMTRGKTRLVEQCRYLVRRPHEIFLGTGEEPPLGAGEPKTDGGELSQEQLLNQPVYIPHRPLRDPREIRLLDPACGSMHFGLYAFDLFETIHEEAWDLEEAGVPSKSNTAPNPDAPTSSPLHSAYPHKAAFLRDVPRLIIGHNLHGIDIDPRCAQIAGLSLWLRAQKTWQRLGVPPAERPRITRSNIVCAEPMPGEKALLREFVESAFESYERPVFARLLEHVFEKMQLAGEAGSLLKIEEEIRTVVAEAKKLWQQGPRLEQARLFVDETPTSKQALLDLSAITDEEFWTRAEERIYTALRSYAEQTENGGGYQRRLFAEDAARGFAFIDICRKRYDVVLMNPPFGDPAKDTKDYLASRFPTAKHDLYGAFVEEGILRQSAQGCLGAITSRTGFFLSSFKRWREETILNKTYPSVFADLGSGVLDGAMVETAAFCLETKTPDTEECTSGFTPFIPKRRTSIFFALLKASDRGSLLKGYVSAARRGELGSSDCPLYLQAPQVFREIPGSPFAYWITENLRKVFQRFGRFEQHGRTVKQGLATADDFRFMRIWSEVSGIDVGRDKAWSLVAKGGEGTPFYSDCSLVVNWQDNGAELKAFASAYRLAHGWGDQWTAMLNSSEFYFRPGLTYPLRSARFSPQVMPEGVIISVRGSGIYFPDRVLPHLALMASRPFDFILKLLLGTHGQPQFDMGDLNAMPTPSLTSTHANILEELAFKAWEAKRSIDSADEFAHAFITPALLAVERVSKLSSACRIKPVASVSLRDGMNRWREILINADRKNAEIQNQIDEIAFELYDLRNADRNVIARSTTQPIEFAGPEDGSEDQSYQWSRDVSSYVVGIVLGRWDVRCATGVKTVAKPPDPFAPLPVCPPGMLQNSTGLPAAPEDVPADYPVRISWPGVLADDENHREDIVRRVREALEAIWPERHELIEQEAYDLLGVRTLRDWFRKPAGFFADHLKRYSKSRRQAPIYWPLSTASGSYTLLIYYHRLNDQTLFHCVNEFVKPKIAETEADLSRVAAEGDSRPGNRIEIERLTALRAELIEFRDELLRVAQLPYKPNLNDGVLITASPLWRLFRLPKWRKDLEACWKALAEGKYDWAHLALTLWPDRVEKGCERDRSIAIAHGLEHLCKTEAPKPKAKRVRKAAATTDGR